VDEEREYARGHAGTVSIRVAVGRAGGYRDIDRVTKARAVRCAAAGDDRTALAARPAYACKGEGRVDATPARDQPARGFHAGTRPLERWIGEQVPGCIRTVVQVVVGRERA